MLRVQWPAFARPLAIAGLASAASAALVVALLHVMPPTSQVDPVRRTISEYGLLENGWVFNGAVLALAVGSAAVLLALIWTRLLPAASGGAAALLLWSAGLAGVSVFPKHNWSLGPSMHGDIHRMAGLLAFVSLPVAALLLARAWLRRPQWTMQARLSAALGLLSLLCFSPIALAILLEPITGVRWWRAIPLGAVERALALVEVVTVLALACWAARAATRAPTRPLAERGSII
jgi:Protein of unknown function (DUF998)